MFCRPSLCSIVHGRPQRCLVDSSFNLFVDILLSDRMPDIVSQYIQAVCTLDSCKYLEALVIATYVQRFITERINIKLCGWNIISVLLLWSRGCCQCIFYFIFSCKVFIFIPVQSRTWVRREVPFPSYARCLTILLLKMRCETVKWDVTFFTAKYTGRITVFLYFVTVSVPFFSSVSAISVD